jgi:hypothetical protein
MSKAEAGCTIACRSCEEAGLACEMAVVRAAKQKATISILCGVLFTILWNWFIIAPCLNSMAFRSFQ